MLFYNILLSAFDCDFLFLLHAGLDIVSDKTIAYFALAPFSRNQILESDGKFMALAEPQIVNMLESLRATLLSVCEGNVQDWRHDLYYSSADVNKKLKRLDDADVGNFNLPIHDNHMIMLQNKLFSWYDKAHKKYIEKVILCRI